MLLSPRVFHLVVCGLTPRSLPRSSRLLSPLALDAALEAIDDRQQKSTALLGQTELMLQHAQYEADRARRQYDAIDPENRLVAGELERRWNERLENVARFEEQLRARRAEIAPALDPTERTELLALATDLPRLWNHPAASMTYTKAPALVISSKKSSCALSQAGYYSRCIGKVGTTLPSKSPRTVGANIAGRPAR